MMKRNTVLKRTLVFFLLLALALSLSLTGYAANAPSDANASHILLYCLNTETVLYEKNAETPIAPGYTAQLMTALLTIEHYPDLDEEVTLDPALLATWYFPNDYRSHVDYGFVKNASLPIKDLLAAMVLENATSAAALLAALIGGSEDGFADIMNARAAALGMTATVYKNGTGMDAEGAVTTPCDLLRLAKLLYGMPAFMDLASSASYTLTNNRFTVYTRNYFIGKWYTSAHLYSNVDGMKTGNTAASGYTVVASSVEDNGYTYIAIVLGGTADLFGNDRTYSLVKDFLKWGSSSFSYLKVLSSAKLVTTLEVKDGDPVTEVAIFPEKDLTLYLPSSVNTDDLSFEHTLSVDSLAAPFTKGTKVGEIVVLYEGKEVGKCALVTGQDVTKGKDAIFREFLGRFFKNPIVIVLILTVALLITRQILIIRRRKRK